MYFKLLLTVDYNVSDLSFLKSLEHTSFSLFNHFNCIKMYTEQLSLTDYNAVKFYCVILKNIVGVGHTIFDK